MKPTARIRLGLAIAVVVGVAAASGAFWLGRDQESLPVTDLVRLEPRIDAGLSPVHAALAWTIEIISGQRVLTDAEFEARLGESLQLNTTAEDFRAELDRAEEVMGAVSLVRVTNIDGDSAGALGTGTNGFLVSNDLEVDELGRVAQWQLTEYFAGQRLPP
ncbi:MAG: hypothetical protein OEO17_16755, partial [Gemmatimonadota bacterium]|nr:hypothetical protein [Gemmatimonadota bacterium]